VKDFNLAKLKQTRARKKQQTCEQTPRGPTATGPQLCKVEAKNNKQHPRNQQIAQIHCIQDCLQKMEKNIL